MGSQEDENGPGGRCGVVYERWISADGTAPGRIVRHDGVRPPSRTWNGDTAGLTKEKDCYQGVVDEVSEKPAPGGSWTEPTRGFVAGLPTDPRALYERAAADIARDGQQLTKEQGIFNYFSDLLLSGSPHLTPALKSAVYRAMALVPGVRDLGTATDLLGRQGVAVAGPEDGDDRTILDPATGELLGESGGYEVARTYAVVNDTASRP